MSPLKKPIKFNKPKKRWVWFFNPGFLATSSSRMSPRRAWTERRSSICSHKLRLEYPPPGVNKVPYNFIFFLTPIFFLNLVAFPFPHIRNKGDKELYTTLLPLLRGPTGPMHYPIPDPRIGNFIHPCRRCKQSV